MEYSNMPLWQIIFSVIGALLAIALAVTVLYIIILFFTHLKFLPVAVRNLVRERKRSALLIGAIAFGMFIITAVNCASEGAVKAISENITRLADGHIFIQGQSKLESGKVVDNLKDKEGILEIIEQSGIEVKKLNRRSEVGLELIFGDNSSGANISGMNWDDELEVQEGLNFKEGSLDRDIKEGLILNEKLAEELDVHVGDTVVGKLRTVTGQTNVGDFYITGILKGTDILSSMISYANIEYINELIGIGSDEYLTIYLKLNSLDVVDSTADLLYSKLEQSYQMRERRDTSNVDIFSLAFSNKEKEWDGQRYTLSTVTEMVGIMDQFVGVVQGISIGVLVLLFIIIIVGVVNTFRMIMYDRVKEIGSMRAMGMHSRAVKTTFIYEGFFLAIVGSLFGIIFSAIVMFIVSFINLGTDHAGSFFLNNGHLVFVPVGKIIFLNTLAVSVITALAVLFPANRAAKLDPAKAIASMY